VRFSVVTPVRNARQLAVETAQSIAAQTAIRDGVEIQYVVVDGASTDGTPDAVAASLRDARGISLHVISEPDDGMYDALGKGLARVDGDWIAYLNAGDLYAPGAFKVVQEISRDPRVSWLTGMRVTYAADGGLISAKVPWSYSRKLIRAGHYGIRRGGRHVQQESTFWSAAANECIDLVMLRRFRLAGDYFIWSQLALHYDLYVVAAHLGGFRFHGGHLSDAAQDYRAEGLDCSTRALPWGHVAAALSEVGSWVPPAFTLRRRFDPRLFVWDRESTTFRLRGEQPAG
jgi:glycosyltransferase involved in cell wall biosynthesis